MAYTTINDPSAYFQTALYNGSSSSVTVTNDGNSNLQPDWLWFKRRSGTASDHNVFDTSRGLTERIFPNLSSASDTTNPNGITSLTDGFTTGTSYGNVNGNGETFVTWQWKANAGTTSSNTDGSITSTVQANTTAGFSIVTWTGNATNPSTIGHGLNQTPDVILLKNRDASSTNWIMYHSANTSAPETDYLILDSTNATANSANVWANTSPTSSVFTVGSAGSVNNNGNAFITYCFAEKQGYSKFGSYTGNQSTNGPFLYFGFKPAFLMVKKTTSAENWFLIDSKRYPINDGNIPRLIPNNADAESEDASIAGDFLSNGFKIRATQNMINESGTYVYMAFAQNPFVATNGVPTTAR